NDPVPTQTTPNRVSIGGGRLRTDHIALKQTTVSADAENAFGKISADRIVSNGVTAILLRLARAEDINARAAVVGDLAILNSDVTANAIAGLADKDSLGSVLMHHHILHASGLCVVNQDANAKMRYTAAANDNI